jgi:uncharacterized protein YdhG (YjbR/CyaY superfamily)
MAGQWRTVEEYIGSFPDDVQAVLQEVRRRILSVVPEAGEKISYQIPAMTLDGKSLVHFAAWIHHLSLYPVPDADPVFAAELAPYLAGKGTLRFPLDEPIPGGLIERVVTLLAQQRHGQPG